MFKTIPIEIINYAELVNGDYYFIDKTLLIKEFLEKKRKVSLVIRPRYFGNTIHMSMLAEFFDITKESKKLFEGTKIMNTPYASQMNQYPVIYLSFASAKRNKKSVIEDVKTQILNEWSKYKYVFENLEKYKQIKHDKLEDALIDLNSDNLNGMDDAIAFLMERLYEYYHKEVMVFIDEYDTPFIEAHVNGFYDDVNGGLAGLLHNSLKASDYLKYGFLTGIQRVSKENAFSDLNNLDVFTVVDEEYAEYFGFTTEETKELLEYYGLELTDEVKEMYDGYKIGNQDIYNPWSIMKYASRKELEPYWVNTSAITMIRNAFKEVMEKNSDFKNDFEALILDGQLLTNVFLETSFYEEASAETLWGFLINAGYLTVEKKISSGQYVLRIPNNEVRGEITKLTEVYLSLPEGRISKLMLALEGEKQNQFLEIYKASLEDASYHDLTSENSYHMMTLGMCSQLRPRYEIISNKEVGHSRCDIILKAKNPNQTSFVLEFKYLKEEGKDVQEKLEQLASQAVQQIINKKYDAGLNGKVVYIGLAHHQKDVVMKWIEKE